MDSFILGRKAVRFDPFEQKATASARGFRARGGKDEIQAVKGGTYAKRTPAQLSDFFFLLLFELKRRINGRGKGIGFLGFSKSKIAGNGVPIDPDGT